MPNMFIICWVGVTTMPSYLQPLVYLFPVEQTIAVLVERVEQVHHAEPHQLAVLDQHERRVLLFW